MSSMVLHIELLDDPERPREIIFRGRQAWTMNELMAAGERGISTLLNPAPRLSHYTFKLRKRGVAIETVWEAHGGPFAGEHGRYVLRSRVRVFEPAEVPHVG